MSVCWEPATPSVASNVPMRRHKLNDRWLHWLVAAIVVAGIAWILVLVALWEGLIW